MAEENAMRGHPAEEAGDPFKQEKPNEKEGPVEVKNKKLNIGGKEVELPEETAQALESYAQSTQQQIQQLQDQNKQLYNYLTEKSVDKQQNKEESSPDDIDENLLYDNPKEFINRISKKVAEQVGTAKQEAVSEVEQKSNAQKKLEQFWRNFWKENSDLNPDRDADIAQAVFDRQASGWSNLTFGQAQDKLAEETRKIISRYKGGSQENDDSSGNFSETPSSNTRSRAKSTQKEQKDEPFTSATELLSKIRNKKGM